MRLGVAVSRGALVTPNSGMPALDAPRGINHAVSLANNLLPVDPDHVDKTT